MIWNKSIIYEQSIFLNTDKKAETKFQIMNLYTLLSE